MKPAAGTVLAQFGQQQIPTAQVYRDISANIPADALEKLENVIDLDMQLLACVIRDNLQKAKTSTYTERPQGEVGHRQIATIQRPYQCLLPK